MARIAALLTVVFAFGCAASAQAATYYVVHGASGTTCAAVDPCGTVEDALAAHRNAFTPSDVIQIGAGSFPQNFEATDSRDNGLTIEGTVLGGARMTAVTGDGLGTSLGFTAAIGHCVNTTVTLRDIAITTETADPSVAAIGIDNGSDLFNVRAANQPLSAAGRVIDVCGLGGDGTMIEGSEVTAVHGDFGIISSAALLLRDTTVTAEDSISVLAASPDELVVRRSRIASSGVPAGGPTLYSVGQAVQLDSALITGGAPAVLASQAPEVLIRNSTLDAEVPGDSGTLDLELDDTPVVTVESSILRGGLGAVGGAGSVTCDYSDLPPPGVAGGWTFACSGGTNAFTPDATALFAGGVPYSWQLRADSPAIDAGRPGGLNGASSTDLLGLPRLAVGLLGSCPTVRLDRGAYERAAVGCPSGGGGPVAPATPITLGPAAGPSGTGVALTAEYVHTATQVFFGEQPARFVVDGFGHITAFAPPGGKGTVDVWALTPNGRVDLGRYTYETPDAEAQTGPAPQPVAVPSIAALCRRAPSLIGRTLAGARSVLLLSGCRAPLSLASSVPDRADRRRRVVSQTPAAGRPAAGVVTVRLGYLPPLKERR
jgi:hypothetical protein